METAESCKTKGNQFLASKNYVEAVNWYSKGIELDRTNYVLYSNRSAAYLTDGKVNEAYEDACKCVEINPSWPKGYSRKGAALQAMRNYDDAIKVLEEGKKVCGDDPLIQRGLDEVLQKKRNLENSAPENSQGEKQLVDTLINLVMTKPQLHHLANDSAFMQKLHMMQINPSLLMQSISDPNMQEVVNVWLAEMGGAGAVPQQNQEETTSPKPTPKPAPKPAPEPEMTDEEKMVVSLKQEGTDFYKKRQFDAALEKYEAVLSIQPNNISVRNNVGAVYLEQGDIDRCIAYCQQTIDMGREIHASFEDMAKTYLRMGNAELKRGDYTAALDYFTSSRTEFPLKGVDDKIRQATKLKAAAAVSAYVNPEEGLKAKERGNKLFLEGDFPGAIREYDEAIRRDPKNATYYNNRGTALSKLMDYGRAMADITKALEFDPMYVKAWMRKGNVEMALKQYHRSVRSFKRGLEIDAEDKGCQDGLTRTQMLIAESRFKPVDPEQQKRSMEDPEIVSLLQDPSLQQALQQIQSDPKSAQKILSDPIMSEKFETLVAAGMIRMG